jgi:UDP-N-acetylmuramate dehydrogenase
MIKIPAAWLIEQCGWKGKRVGNVGVHDRQALVLVNHGGATGEEIFALANKIIADVKEKFGLELTPEVNLI